MPLTSPYNFVPLSERVFYPNQAGPIFDVPFSDGVSGELEIVLEAKRPLYVRNAAEKPEDLGRFFGDNYARLTAAERRPFDEWVSFARLFAGGPFAIPATTIKGAVRNVLKIASCGSMRDAASEDRYAVRDIRLPAYQKTFVRGGSRDSPEIHFQSEIGWLHSEGARWTLFPCASPVQRVEQNDLARLATQSARRLTRDSFVATKDAANSVQAKYDLWASSGMDLTLGFTPGRIQDQVRRHSKGRHPLRLVYGLADVFSPGRQGRLVFTGQPSRQKHMEFLFDLPPASGTAGGMELSRKQVEEFIFAHEESEGWAYWRPRLEAGDAVPVFWLKGDHHDLRAFGLAQMFRLPAPQTLSDGIPRAHFQEQPDVADLIFGSLHGAASRGRASFSAFLRVDGTQPEEPIWTVLGSPKPTFYPNYLEQECKQGGAELQIPGRWRTLLSESIRLRGWKRYAVWPDLAPGGAIFPNRHRITGRPEKFDSVTALAPLPAGTRFSGRLRFHNLRPWELGALVWTLEWGGREDLRHALGMAKGMGFGSVTMRIVRRDEWSAETFSGHPISLDSAREAFVSQMKAFEPKWESTDALGELLMLANPVAGSAPLLAYPELVMGGANDFTAAKAAAEVLPSYGQLTGRRPRQQRYVPDSPESSGRPAAPLARPPRPAALDVERTVAVSGPARPAPILLPGQVVLGTLIAQPGPSAGSRIYFRPDGHPELDGNTGKKVGDAESAIGQRWRVTVASITPPTYRLGSRIDG